ncbi:class I SAM-dependent methyltransferase [uncultured Maricaulis sp.]|uniref:class I SAM-dependent DNA methyltransferase n=1 Tax=uncultured Maricaulis sp. TaxID=174710 RepID=UPI0030D7BBAA|tara:strand:- start:165947 stop:166540 length:594 start_codon:yes stop_codon:yes gene_type:complete
MTDSWNEYAEGWDDNPAVKHYANQAFVSLDARFDMSGASWKSKRVLDFGCGTGLLAEKIAPHVHELIAVDTSQKMIAVLNGKNLGNVTAVHGDILDKDFRIDGDWFSNFDLIYASSVCSFLPDYEHAVPALARLLRRGGHFVQWDWQASGGDGFGLSENQISAALNQAKLHDIRVGPAFTIDAEGESMPVLIGVGTL